MDDVELEIRISGIGGRRHRALVVRGPSAVGGSQIFELPEDRGLPSGAGDWRDVRRRLPPRDKSLLRILTEQGRDLFELVFAKGDTNFAFQRAYELARDRRHWFRLQFSFDHAPEAVDLPWEALVGPDGNALALLPQVSIERRLVKAPSFEAPRATSDGKIRALVAGASPRDLSPIGVMEEKKWIKLALGKAVEVRPLEHTSLSKLGKELAVEPGFDLLHFLGHGDFEGEEGGLWLEDERGDGVRLSSHELPPTLRRPVSFVFLNVCHGGRSSATPFAGLAEALLRSGVRGVVAMRREISDKGAVDLAKHFYKCVAQGESLTRALAKARGSVADIHFGDWAVPMLFLAGEDFALLQRPSPTPTELIVQPQLAEPPPPKPADAPPPYIRGLFARPAEGKKVTWTLRLTGALLVAALIAAFGLWFDWLPRYPPDLIQIDDRPSTSPKPQALFSGSNLRCPPTSDPTIEFVLIRAGTFLQGNDRGKKEEQPAHPVELRNDYCLGKFEITRGQFAAVLGRSRPSATEMDLPIADIRWEETQEFLRLLNGREPKAIYALPTDAQWEYAARAGTATRYSFGDDEDQLFRYGNCLSREGGNDRFERAAPVGSFKPNPWGLYDMHGNVWEWVQDYWGDYSSEKMADPRGPSKGVARVRRGGAYDSALENCRSSSRQATDLHRKQKTIGFRIARTPLP